MPEPRSRTKLPAGITHSSNSHKSARCMWHNLTRLTCMSVMVRRSDLYLLKVRQDNVFSDLSRSSLRYPTCDIFELHKVRQQALAMSYNLWSMRSCLCHGSLAEAIQVLLALAEA